MKLPILAILLGAAGNAAVTLALGQEGMETLIGKLVAQSPLVASLVVVIYMFLKHLTQQREDHKAIMNRSLDTTEKQIEATQINTAVCESIRQTMAENTRSFDRLDRTLLEHAREKR